MLATASCKFPFLEEWKGICEKNKIYEFVDSVLSGYAQIAFNDNVFSAIIMLIATWIGSPVQCISAVWATIVSTACAYILGIPRGLIRCGLYGFNAALAGLAIPIVIFPGQGLSISLLITSTIAAIMCVFLTTSLGNFFGNWGVPSLATPYCFAVLILSAASVLVSTTEITRVVPETLAMATTQPGWTFGEFVSAVLNGAGQVIWVEKPICGILYIIALLPASRMDAVNTVITAVLSTLVAIALGFPKEAIMLGLYGYNSVLLMKVLTRGFVFSVRSYVISIVIATFTPIVCAAFKVMLAPIGLNSFLAFPYAFICILVFMGRDKLGGLTYIPGRNWGVPETINRNYKEGKLEL